MTIWKYPVHSDRFSAQIPRGGKFLSVQEQTGHPVMWFMVDESEEKETRFFRTYPTGRIDDEIPGQYLGSVQMMGGNFVVHLFEEKEPLHANH